MSQGSVDKLKKKIIKLPDTPGVYFFLGPKKDILYIGKATSLKDRVRSYFGKDLISTRGQLLVDMVENARSIDFRKTDSVLEALLLEASLIKNYQPYYNTKEKDDKSFSYVVITEEAFPRVLLVRGRNIMNAFPKEQIKLLFGPFPHGGMLRNAMKIIRKLFPYRDNCVPSVLTPSRQGETPLSLIRRGAGGENRVPRPCFNYQIGLCPGVCAGKVTEKEYAQTIKHLQLFFEGKKKQLTKMLEKEMKAYAKLHEFEKAEQAKRTLFGINHIQDVALIKEKVRTEIGPLQRQTSNIFRIEAYDIAHMSGKNTVGVMTVIEDGEVKKSDYRKFRIRGQYGVHDIAGLQEVLRRRLNHPEWAMPNLIVVDGNAVQKRAAEAVLRERRMFTIPVAAVVKNNKHKPEAVIAEAGIADVRGKEILLANSEAHRFAITYHRKKRDILPI